MDIGFELEILLWPLLKSYEIHVLWAYNYQKYWPMPQERIEARLRDLRNQQAGPNQALGSMPSKHNLSESLIRKSASEVLADKAQI